MKISISPERMADVMLRFAIVPVLIALIYEGSFGSLRWVARGDQAVLELLLREAMHGSHLLGPYSQYSWYHPGPLYYYVLAPFYLLGGSTTSSLYFAAGVLSLLSVLGLVFVHASRDRTHLGRAILAVFLSGTVALVAARVPDGALVASPLTEIWNPIVTLLPFALMIVAGAAVASGSQRLLPLLVFIHAFVTQTHVSYLLPATLILGVSVASGLLGSNFKTKRKWLFVSGGLAVALWLAPIVAMLRGDFGNALDVARFVLFGEKQKVPLLEGLGYAVRQLHAPVLRPLSLGAGPGTAFGVALLAVQWSAAAWWIRRTRWREMSYRNALAIFPALLTLVALIQSLQLISTDERVYYYQTLWYGVVGCFGWLAPAMLLVERASSLAAGRERRLLVAFAALQLFALGGSWYEIEHDFRRGATLGAQVIHPDPVTSTAGALADVLRGHRKDYVVTAESPSGWGTLAGVLLELRKQGRDAKVSKRWQFMFGNGTSYANEEPNHVIEISSAGFSHSAPIFKAFGTTTLAVPGTLAHVEPRVIAVRGKSVVGDVQRPVFGPPAPEAVAWNAGGAVILKEDSWLELDLPQVLVGAVELVGDGNDAYIIEASEDGKQFNSVGVIPPVNAWGLRRRRVKLSEAGPFLNMRVRAGRGDGSYSIAELRLLDVRHACQVVSTKGVERDPGLLCDGSSPKEGTRWDDPAALKLKDSGASVVVALPSLRVGDGIVDGFSLLADGNDAFKVEGSFDRTSFHELGKVPSPNRPGLRASVFYFNDGTQWPFIRLSPLTSDGLCTIAEIGPLVSAGTLLEFGSPSARAHMLDGWSADERSGSHRWNWALGMSAGLSVPLKAGAAHRVLIRARAAPTGAAPNANGKQLVTVGFNQWRLTEFELGPTPQEQSFDLPANMVGQENNLRFVFRSSVQKSEGDTRPLAALFESILFRPKSD